MIKDLCKELGVLTEPARIGGVWIAPIYSWYHASFDREPDLPGAPAVEKASHCFRTPGSCCAKVIIWSKLVHGILQAHLAADTAS